MRGLECRTDQRCLGTRLRGLRIVRAADRRALADLNDDLAGVAVMVLVVATIGGAALADDRGVRAGLSIRVCHVASIRELRLPAMLRGNMQTSRK